MNENKTIPAAIYAHRGWVRETNPEELTHHYGGLLEKVGFQILSFVEHRFDNGGYTAVWLLAESHFAIHTFPEEKKTYIELSSCNEAKMMQFEQLNQALLIE